MAEPDDFESIVQSFERRWQEGIAPDVSDYLQRQGDAPASHRLLIELVCVDLEYRWRATACTHGDRKWTLRDYYDRLDELQSLDELPLELIEEEYRVRCRWGDRPSHESFVETMGEPLVPGTKNRRAEIRRRLDQIDRELRDEKGDPGQLPGQSDPADSLTRRKVAVPDPRAALQYSDYLLQEMIGAGRMGRVYRAWQRSVERAVALKYLRKSFQSNPDAVKRFVDEANTVSHFEHSGIVRIHGLGRSPGAGYFIAMDLVEGADMSRRIGRQGVAVAEALRWMIQACDAIGHAHERGVIHCDLKPANLLVDRNENVRVTDFGLARSIGEEARPVDRIEGTAGFMAPEQVSGWWGAMSPRTDVYGIGAVLFTLLTAEPPFNASNIADILAQVVSGAPAKSPAELRPDVPESVNEICARCLAKSPASRYENMWQLGTALRRSLESL